MESNVKACILSAYAPGTTRGENTGSSPYPAGQQALYRSIVLMGFRHDVLLFQDWPNNNFDKSCGYNVKASAWTEAVKRGYEVILWLDSSVRAIRAIEPIFDIINHEGWYFWKNGFNCAKTCDDNALQYFGITRDEAEEMPDITTSMFGLHLGNPVSREFYNRWIQSARDGMWVTSRYHNGGSQDPRFEFDRQDQSCASVIWNQSKYWNHEGGRAMTAYEPNVYSSIWHPIDTLDNHPEPIIFTMRGL